MPFWRPGYSPGSIRCSVPACRSARGPTRPGQRDVRGDRPGGQRRLPRRRGRRPRRQRDVGQSRHRGPRRTRICGCPGTGRSTGRSLADLPAAGARVVGVGLAVPAWSTVTSRTCGWHRASGWREVSPYPCSTSTAGCHASGDWLSTGNDADLAAWLRPSLMKSVAPQDRTFLYVSGEVGVGASIVLAGRTFRGRHGWSGELGIASSTPPDRRASAAPSAVSRSMRAHQRCCRPPGWSPRIYPGRRSGAAEPVARPRLGAARRCGSRTGRSGARRGHRRCHKHPGRDHGRARAPLSDIADLLRPDPRRGVRSSRPLRPWATPEIRAGFPATSSSDGSPAGDQRRPGRPLALAGGSRPTR